MKLATRVAIKQNIESREIIFHITDSVYGPEGLYQDGLVFPLSGP